MVPVFRRFAYRGVDAIVIPQPDGSVACIPEWMTHERAAHFKLAAEPGFPPEVLRSLRAEIDALLAFLPSESTREQDGHDAKGRKSRKPQPGLFDQDEPSVALTPAQSARLATLVATLLIEIAVALASGEGGDEQDHR